MKYHSAESLARTARKLRVQLGIDYQHQPSILDVLQRLKSLGYISDVVRASEQVMHDAEARFTSRGRKLFLSKNTYDAALRGDSRARWTIAHEIGHAVLGHPGIKYRKSSPTERKRTPEIRRHEQEAHRFAAEFLAPSHLVDSSKVRTEQELATRFGLSREAARIRLKELRTSSDRVTETESTERTASQIGEDYYKSIRVTLEKDHYGSYVMIHLETAEYVVSETTSRVHTKFIERFGESAAGWCTRIGASVFATA
jgi:IrrE N-terminal-like domain